MSKNNNNNTFSDSKKYQQQKQIKINNFSGNDTTEEQPKSAPKLQDFTKVVQDAFYFAAKDPYETQLSKTIYKEINKFNNDLVTGKARVEVLGSFLVNLYKQAM
ncbi:hypothetical protein [Candidatus Trichorickettsia mobilis]|uniref:hypothetical protein n=1 Tax=Candidatus Trichorickettsia mobilis TaxID=1346319 RepID=UPI00292F0B17|nr:hypothetical protein [Candidatus Trichorickettsia mobilis]